MRLTDEQRERVAAWVPHAKRLAAKWARRRHVAPWVYDDVRAAFLAALPGVVVAYDPARCESLERFINGRLAMAAVDEMRRDTGRGPGAEWRRGLCSLSRMVLTSCGQHGRESLAVLVPSRDPGPDSRAVLADMVAEIRNRLPKRLATVLLGFACDVPRREIAAKLGLSQTRVFALRKQALRKLRASGFMAHERGG